MAKLPALGVLPLHDFKSPFDLISSPDPNVARMPTQSSEKLIAKCMQSSFSYVHPPPVKQELLSCFKQYGVVNAKNSPNSDNQDDLDNLIYLQPSGVEFVLLEEVIIIDNQVGETAFGLTNSVLEADQNEAADAEDELFPDLTDNYPVIDVSSYHGTHRYIFEKSDISYMHLWDLLDQIHAPLYTFDKSSKNPARGTILATV